VLLLLLHICLSHAHTGADQPPIILGNLVFSIFTAQLKNGPFLFFSQTRVQIMHYWG
jgi:hypothetical protein